MASHSSYTIQADEEEEEDLISTSSASLLPPLNSSTKGKERSQNDPLAGKIGSGSRVGVGERKMVGGIQTETRFVLFSFRDTEG